MKNLMKIGLCMLLVVLFLSFQTTEAKAYSANINYNIADDINNANSIDTENGAKVHLYDFLKTNSATFTDYDGSLLKGDYDATFIGYRAGHTNIFYDKNSYDKNDPSTFFSTGKGHPDYASDAGGDPLTINAASTYFFDVTDGKPNPKLGVTDKSLQYYILKKDWTYTGTVGTTLNFLSGDIIVGFNDDGSHTDHLDLVVALRPSNVPIPGAIWLLGSGLLGLVGIRRRNS